MGLFFKKVYDVNSVKRARPERVLPEQVSSQTGINRSILFPCRGKDALGVFGEDVAFKIHLVTDSQIAEIGFLSGVRDNPDCERIGGDLGHSEAHAVDCHRTFISDVTRKVRRHVKVEPEVSTTF